MEEEALGAIDTPVDVQQEKMLTASQVNEIVKREKAKAAQNARAETEARLAQQMGSVNLNSGFDPAALKEELGKEIYGKFMQDLQEHQEKTRRKEQEKHLKGIADKYYLKMGKGSQLFEDFNEILGDFEPDKFPETVMLAAEMEHTPEIMYELANNPSKLQEIEFLAQRSPRLAMKQLEKLQSSIGKNLEAKANVASAPAPLSRLKSSSVGADTGKMSMRDLKKASYLRG